MIIKGGVQMKSRFHIALMATLLVSSSLWSVDSSFAGPPEWPECVTSGLTQGVIGMRTIDGQKYFVRRMATIFDNALDDFGETGVGDQLEIFCVSRTSSDRFGKIAICRSAEKCPWRPDDLQD
jgi:hypothetical protein